MGILEKGILKHKVAGEIIHKKYHMTFIDKTNLDEILELQNIVVSELVLHDIFEPDSFQFIEDELLKNAFIIGVYCEGQLIAYRFITFPKGDVMNIGDDLGLPKEELSQVAHLETTIVHPEFRGNRLQRKTLDYGMVEIEKKGYRHICTTISPKNYFSIKNIMSASLVIKLLKYKYATKPDLSDGKLRFILHRDLKENIVGEYDKIILFDNDSIEAQQKALTDGYVGFKVLPLEDKVAYGFKINFGLNTMENSLIS